MNGKTVRRAFLIAAFLAVLIILLAPAFSSTYTEWIVSSEFTISSEWSISTTPSSRDESPPQTSSSQTVLFKVTMNGKPQQNCQIRISTTTYQDYVGTYMTDSNGEATVYLDVGTYDYSATYQQKRVSGSFQHIEEETIELDLGTGETSQRSMPGLDRTQVTKIGVGLIAVVAAVFAVTFIAKKRR